MNCKFTNSLVNKFLEIITIYTNIFTFAQFSINYLIRLIIESKHFWPTLETKLDQGLPFIRLSIDYPPSTSTPLPIHRFLASRPRRRVARSDIYGSLYITRHLPTTTTTTAPIHTTLKCTPSSIYHSRRFEDRKTRSPSEIMIINPLSTPPLYHHKYTNNNRRERREHWLAEI